jgi:phage gp29-like protein
VAKIKKSNREKAIVDLRSNLEEIKNVDVKLPENADVFKRLEFNATSLVRASVLEWSFAYEDAKDVNVQFRNDLIEIYETIEIDTHVSAIVETISNSITQRDFFIMSGDKIDEEKTKIFKASWFDDFMSIALDTTNWGYTGIQLGAVEDDKFTSIRSIPRQNIKPETNKLKIDSFSRDGDLSLDKEPYKTWVILLFPQLPGDQYKLGKFNKLAKMFILKREVIGFWGIYNEIFGTPYRVMKTSIVDDIRRENAENAMKQMSTAAFSVIDQQDEVEFISSSGNSGMGFQTFESFIGFANKEMSKCMIGSTMVLDDGSSRSQSEVHQDNTSTFINSRAKWVKNVVNDKLIPRMAKIGFPINEDDKFQWKEEDKLTKLEHAEIFTKLNTIVDIPIEALKETFGIEFEEKQIEVEVTDVEPENQSRANKISNFYKKIFK